MAFGVNHGSAVGPPLASMVMSLPSDYPPIVLRVAKRHHGAITTAERPATWAICVVQHLGDDSMSCDINLSAAPYQAIQC